MVLSVSISTLLVGETAPSGGRPCELSKFFDDLESEPMSYDKFHDLLGGTLRVRESLKHILEGGEKIQGLSPALERLASMRIFKTCENGKDKIDWSFFWRLNLIRHELLKLHDGDISFKDMHDALHNRLRVRFINFVQKCIQGRALVYSESADTFELTREMYDKFKTGPFTFSEWKSLKHLDNIGLKRQKKDCLPSPNDVFISIMEEEHGTDEFYETLGFMVTYHDC